MTQFDPLSAASFPHLARVVFSARPTTQWTHEVLHDSGGTTDRVQACAEHATNSRYAQQFY